MLFCQRLETHLETFKGDSMKIGIAGYGYVGQAHELILKDYYDIIISDPAKNQYGNLKYADAIIVCVSTPSSANGYCDVSNVCDVIDESPNVPILIKSTISCEGWRLIIDTCKNKDITFSPEYLRAQHWNKDIVDNKDWYLGGANIQFWSDVLLNALGKINISINQPQELIMAKQLRNSFLALKVTFFNQVYDFCKAQQIDYESVRKNIVADKRIGESHSQVTDERGFGGHCFPKDTLATVRSAQVSGGRITLLEEALEYNDKVKNI